ncbi:hypothetical protein IWZ01DRAFT_499699 [Phyllosticta capitalensis]
MQRACADPSPRNPPSTSKQRVRFPTTTRVLEQHLHQCSSSIVPKFLQLTASTASTKTTTTKMSAPNPGRQSPEPEQQTGAQQQAAQAAPNDLGGQPAQGTKQANEDQKANLSSNPTHPLEKHSEETTSKTK